MKKILFLLSGLLVGLSVSARPGGPWGYDYDDGYYDEYFDGDYGDLYKYGFELNNYVADYDDLFVTELAREYRVPRADLRYYIRKGYSPSDLLFGLEMARRSGYTMRRVMDLYYGSRDRNWIDVSVRLGFGPTTPGFGLVLDRFRSHCRYWNDYYVRRNPRHIHPPVYNHPWSYFRPHAPHGIRPAPGPRRPPVGPFHPGPVRPPHKEQGPPPRPEYGRKLQNPYYRRGPIAKPDRPVGSPSRPERPSSPERPSQTGRPSRPDRPERPSRPSRPDRPDVPSRRPENPAGSAAGRPDGNNGYRRGETRTGKQSDSKGRPSGSSSENRGGSYRR